MEGSFYFWKRLVSFTIFRFLCASLVAFVFLSVFALAFVVYFDCFTLLLLGLDIIGWELAPFTRRGWTPHLVLCAVLLLFVWGRSLHHRGHFCPLPLLPLYISPYCGDVVGPSDHCSRWALKPQIHAHTQPLQSLFKGSLMLFPLSYNSSEWLMPSTHVIQVDPSINIWLAVVKFWPGPADYVWTWKLLDNW